MSNRSLLEGLKKVYEVEDCFMSHDMTLVSRENEEVRAHQIILAAQCDFLNVSQDILGRQLQDTRVAGQEDLQYV